MEIIPSKKKYSIEFITGIIERVNRWYKIDFNGNMEMSKSGYEKIKGRGNLQFQSVMLQPSQ